MEHLMKADIFFFVTTIAVAVISILVVIGLIYIILILKTTKDFVKKVKVEGEQVMEDIKDLRVKMRTSSAFGKFPAVFEFIRKMYKLKKSKK